VPLAHADAVRADLEGSLSTTQDKTAGTEPWDIEWAAEKAAQALRYLGRDYPECLENLRVLDEHEMAAHEAAMRGARDAYLEVLRGYMRAGRDEALRIRRGQHEHGISICPGPHGLPWEY
jgi:hypothetical protein